MFKNRLNRIAGRPKARPLFATPTVARETPRVRFDVTFH
jgi:hypothetical protein